MENALKYSQEIEAIKNEILLPLAKEEVVLMNVSALDRCMAHAYTSPNDTIVDLFVNIANNRPFSDFNKRIALKLLRFFYVFDSDTTNYIMEQINTLTNNEFEDENELEGYVRSLEVRLFKYKQRKTPETVIYYREAQDESFE